MASTEADSAAGFEVVRTLRLDRAAEAAAAARAALDQVEPRVDPALMDDLRLLISELVTGAVRQAAREAPGSLVFQLAVLAGGVRVELRSTGQRWLFVSAESAFDMEGGPVWGLYLVDRLADRWGIRRTADTDLWFELDGGSR